MDRGYEFAEFRLVDGIELRLWSGCQMAFTATLPSSAVIKLREHRWVGGRRAVYFDMRVREQQDSIFIEDDAKVLFDFHTAQLHIASPLLMWRRRGEGYERWLTNTEFDELIRRIDAEKSEH